MGINVLSLFDGKSGGMCAFKKQGIKGKIKTVDSYYDNEKYNKAIVERIKEAVGKDRSEDFSQENSRDTKEITDKDFSEFQDSTRKGRDYFKKVIRELINKGMKTDETDIKKIIINIETSFKSPDDRGTNTRCKLMGLDFFYSMLKLGPEKMREFGTDMVYISQKKGTKKKDTFGPFGKVY